MYVMQISKHNPESCPFSNKESRKTMLAVMQSVDSLLPKHGVTMVGAWNDLGMHTLYVVYDTPSMDAYMALVQEPELAGWLSFHTVDYKAVQGRDEMTTMLG